MQPEHENINGEHGAILREINLISISVGILKSRQMDVLTKMEKLDNLPCERHIEKFKQYDNTRKFLAGTICVVIFAICSFCVAWGSLNGVVTENTKDITTLCQDK